MLQQVGAEGSSAINNFLGIEGDGDVPKKQIPKFLEFPIGEANDAITDCTKTRDQNNLSWGGDFLKIEKDLITIDCGKCKCSSVCSLHEKVFGESVTS